MLAGGHWVFSLAVIVSCGSFDLPGDVRRIQPLSKAMKTDSYRDRVSSHAGLGATVRACFFSAAMGWAGVVTSFASDGDRSGPLMQAKPEPIAINPARTAVIVVDQRGQPEVALI
jgi:hypothetical protein